MSEDEVSFTIEIPIGPITPEQQRELEQGNPWVLVDILNPVIEEDAPYDALSGDSGASPPSDTRSPAEGPPAPS